MVRLFFFYIFFLFTSFMFRFQATVTATKETPNENIIAFLQVRRRFFNSVSLKGLWGLKYERTAT